MSNSVSVIIKAIDQATAPIRKIVRGLEELGRASVTRKLVSSFDNLKSSISNVGRETQLLAQRFALLGGAGVGLFAAFLKPASEMENLRFRLNALYKDGKKAEQIFNFIADFAIKSPYSFSSITDSLLMLKGQGFENLKQFQNILNFLAVYVPDEFRATNAIIQMSQAWGKAKLQMQDIRPMIEAGVPVWKLLEKVTGKNTAQLMKMSEKGQLTRDIMLKMFTRMGEEAKGTGGKIQNLLTTKLSNLVDVWKRFADRVMNTDLGRITVFQEIKDDLQKLIDLLQNGFSGKTGKEFAQTLADIYHTGKELALGLLAVGKAVTPLVQEFTKLVGGVRNAILTIGALIAIPLVMSLVATAGAVWGVVSSFFAWIAAAETLWAALGIVLAIVELIANPIAWAVAGVMALAAAAAFVAANWKPLSEWFSQMWVEWGGLIRTIFPAIGMLVDLAQVVMQNRGQISGFLQGVCDLVKEAFTILGKAITDTWDGIKNSVLGVVDAMRSVARMIPNVNVSTGQAYKTSGAQGVKASGLPLGAPAKLGGPVQQVAVQPKRDTLEVAMVINAEGRPTVTGVKNKGDSNLDFNASMGRIAPA